MKNFCSITSQLDYSNNTITIQTGYNTSTWGKQYTRQIVQFLIPMNNSVPSLFKHLWKCPQLIQPDFITSAYSFKFVGKIEK